MPRSSAAAASTRARSSPSTSSGCRMASRPALALGNMSFSCSRRPAGRGRRLRSKVGCGCDARPECAKRGQHAESTPQGQPAAAAPSGHAALPHSPHTLQRHCQQRPPTWQVLHLGCQPRHQLRPHAAQLLPNLGQQHLRDRQAGREGTSTTPSSGGQRHLTRQVKGRRAWKERRKPQILVRHAADHAAVGMSQGRTQRLAPGAPTRPPHLHLLQPPLQLVVGDAQLIRRHALQAPRQQEWQQQAGIIGDASHALGSLGAGGWWHGCARTCTCSRVALQHGEPALRPDPP